MNKWSTCLYLKYEVNNLKKKDNKTVYKNDKVLHLIFDFALFSLTLGAADPYFGMDSYGYINEVK